MIRASKIVSVLAVLLVMASCQMPMSRKVALLDQSYELTARQLTIWAPKMDTPTKATIAKADNVAYSAIKAVNAAAIEDPNADVVQTMYDAAVEALAQLKIQLQAIKK